MELFGESLAIGDFPPRQDVSGIGLSDSEIYSTRLTRKLNYTNTFYHQEPFLDIAATGPPKLGKHDFLLCSDVFEHVAPPVSKAFENLRALLKPGGVVIFSVPYRAGETLEHYPDLAKYSVQKNDGEYVLDNLTIEGHHQRFTNLTFHGGPGTVLEMRIFGEDSLNKQFLDAGFEKPTIHAEEVRQFGIAWNPYVAENAPYRPLIFALETPPWAVRVSGRVAP
jgi:SAM-dependent methyltransferase